VSGIRTLSASAAGLAAFVLLGLLGGPSSPTDRGVILWWTAWRATHPGATGALVAFTQLGSAPVLIGLLAIAMVGLLLARRGHQAVILALTVLSARVMAEGIKLLVNRPRPSFDAHPVVVTSKSFPSAHATNSMATLVALAVFAAPERWRRPALIGAILLSLAIGCTRPMLGVHWPSDVLAGWLFGLVWVGAARMLSRRARTEA
jgi:membrane-associated phospholipid phosphatase